MTADAGTYGPVTGQNGPSVQGPGFLGGPAYEDVEPEYAHNFTDGCTWSPNRDDVIDGAHPIWCDQPPTVIFTNPHGTRYRACQPHLEQLNATRPDLIVATELLDDIVLPCGCVPPCEGHHEDAP